MVIFLSDNGCPSQFGACDCSHPINAGKFTQLEGGVRVPFLVSWPKGIPERGIIDRPVSSLDILPTALAAARVQPAPGVSLDGLSLFDAIRRPEPDGGRALMWRQIPVYSVRSGKWKLWKSLDLKQVKLFDLEADPGETKDVSAAHPDIVSRLDAELERWQAGLAPPAWEARRIDEVTICGRVTESVV
jgi:arylsulfatase A-like enzyme